MSAADSQSKRSRFAILSDIGITVDVGSIVVTVTGIITAAYYALAKWAEAKWPQVGWLLGYAKAPSYNK